MIFSGHKELADKIDYRDRALKRKQKFCLDHELQFSGVDQIEFIIREVMERVYIIHPDYPCVDVAEKGDLSVSRNKVELSPSAYSQKTDHGYRITLTDDMPVALGRYIGEIFEDAEFLEKHNQMKGYLPKLKIYEKPIYDFNAYSKYRVCKKELRSFLLEISIWYISLHEYAHIINGHCDLDADCRVRKVSLDIEQKRALEVHADLMAAELLFEVIKSWEKYIGVLQIVPQRNGKNPGLSFLEEIVFATVGVYICFRSFLDDEKWDEWSVRIHEMRRISHPLTEVRMAIVSNFFLNKLLDLAQNAEEYESIKNQFFCMITQYEEFCYENLSDGSKKDAVFYNPTLLIRTEDGKKYYKELFDATIKLNELLGKYMLVPNILEGKWVDYDIIPYVVSPLN